MASPSMPYYPREPSQNGYHRDVSPMMSRTESVASDGLSMISGVTAILPNFLNHINPPPEYISQSSASQVANETQDAHRGRLSDDEDAVWDRPVAGRVAVAESSVALVNGFLDKLLYDLLSTARSTSLLALKPAVADILKKSLARDATASAEANLEDLLALHEDDDDDPRTPNSARWNIEFIWKRSRLRIMMRSDKSEFDIDDDERYVQEEGLVTPGRRFSQSTSVISLSAEIFLAGVLDYVGEQLISNAAIGARQRTQRQSAMTTPDSLGMTHVLVQDPDIEKAALNSSMDRLWRTWRKSLRAKGFTGGSMTSLNSSLSPSLQRRGSQSTFDGSVVGVIREQTLPNIPDMQHPEHVLASNIPLPTSPMVFDENKNGSRDLDEKAEAVRTPVSKFSTRARLEHRPSRSVNNADFDRSPNLSETPDRQRPYSTASPIVTPFVDAPGAWPRDSPNQTRDLDQISPIAQARTSSSATYEEYIRQSLIMSESSAAPPNATKRVSKIRTLDLSQLNSHSRSSDSSGSTASDGNDNSGEKTPKGLGIAASGGISAAAIAAAMAAISTSKGLEDSKEPGQRSPAIAEELGRRKSNLDLRNHIVSQRSSNENLAGSRAHNGDSQDLVTKEVKRRSSESERSTHTNTSYTLIDPRKASISAERATPQHYPQAENLSDADSLAAEAPDVARRSPRGSPSIRDEAMNIPARNGKRPQFINLPIRTNSTNETQKTVDGTPTSPRDFLASRNLSPSLTPARSPSIVLARSPSGSPRDQFIARTGSSPRLTLTGPMAIHPAIRNSPSSQGLGITNGSANASPVTRSPRLTPKASADLLRSRASDKEAFPSYGADRSDMPGPLVIGRGSISKTDTATTQSPLNKLTSASITSPEDFDVFLQNYDTLKYGSDTERTKDQPASAKSPQNGSKENIDPAGNRSYGRSIEDDRTVPARPSRSTTPVAATAAMPKGKGKETRPAPRERSKSISRPPPQNVAPVASGQILREATVQTQSTQDFADFIRSTGPDEEPDTLIPLLASRSSASLRSLANSQATSKTATPTSNRSRSASNASMSRTATGAPSPPPIPLVPVPDRNAKSPATSMMRSPNISRPTVPLHEPSGSQSPVKSILKSPKPSQIEALSPRKASGALATGNSSELIDFIRNGPAGQQHIPNHIAPFNNVTPGPPRRTVDSVGTKTGEQHIPNHVAPLNFAGGPSHISTDSAEIETGDQHIPYQIPPLNTFTAGPLHEPTDSAETKTGGRDIPNYIAPLDNIATGPSQKSVDNAEMKTDDQHMSNHIPPLNFAGGPSHASTHSAEVKTGERFASPTYITAGPSHKSTDSAEIKMLNERLQPDRVPDLTLKPYIPRNSSSAISTIEPQSSNEPTPTASRLNSTTPTSRTTSTGTSANSATALLPNGKSNDSAMVVQPAYSTQAPRLSNLNVPVTFPPVRNRYRNKDPYPIDNSEDEDMLTALPTDTRPEESMMDFLKSSSPPPDNAPALLNAAGQAQARAMVEKARADSVSNLRAATSPMSSPSIGSSELPATQSRNSGLPSPTTNGHQRVYPSFSPSPDAGPSSFTPLTPQQQTMQQKEQLYQQQLHDQQFRLQQQAQNRHEFDGHPGYEPSIADDRSTTSNVTSRPAHIRASVSSGNDKPIPKSRRGSSGSPTLTKTDTRSSAAKNAAAAKMSAFHPAATNTVGTGDVGNILNGSASRRESSTAEGLGLVDSAPAPGVGDRGEGIMVRGPEGKKFWKKKTYLDLP